MPAAYRQADGVVISRWSTSPLGASDPGQPDARESPSQDGDADPRVVRDLVNLLVGVITPSPLLEFGANCRTLPTPWDPASRSRASLTGLVLGGLGHLSHAPDGDAQPSGVFQQGGATDPFELLATHESGTHPTTGASISSHSSLPPSKAMEAAAGTVMPVRT